MNGRVPKTLATFLLFALAGCASLPFHHKKVVPPPALQPEPPDMSQTPLYTPEMSENNPRVPSLPSTATRAVVPEPPPTPKPRKVRRVKPPVAPAKNPVPAPAKASETDAGTTQAAASGAVESAPTTSTPGDREKKPAAEQALNAPDSGAASPIGELTAGSSADAAQTSHNAEDLIKSTKDGVDGIKRALSDDEKKTAAEIRTFLDRANRALKNGDVDGAYGLATKAKILLDELTQK